LFFNILFFNILLFGFMSLHLSQSLDYRFPTQSAVVILPVISEWIGPDMSGTCMMAVVQLIYPQPEHLIIQ